MLFRSGCSPVAAESCAPGPLKPGIRLDTGSREILASPDTALIIRSAQEAAAGIEIGKLAASRAADPEIRALAQQQVDGCTALQRDLMQIASERAITLPTSPAIGGIQAYDKLSRLSGRAFDLAYLSDTQKGSENQLKQFTREAKSGKNEQIQAFATKRVPDLQSTVEKVKSIRAKFAGGSSI